MLLQVLLIAAAILGITRNLFLTWKNIVIFPESIPWIGRRDQYLSRLKACGREFFAGLETMKAGYDKVCVAIRTEVYVFAAN